MAFKQRLITASTLMMQALGELIPLPKSVRMTLDGFEFMRTVTGYQSSAAVNAAKKLGLFQFLETQKSVKEIAEFLKMTVPAAKVLLDPLVVACIAKPRTVDGVEAYGLTDFGRKIFLSKYWNTQSSTVDFMDGSWDKWKDLPEILQGNDGHPDLKVYNPESPLILNSASMMTSMLYRPAQELSRQLDLSNVNDIVCGTVGVSMAKAMMEQKPSIDLTVCCLPQLIEVLPTVLKQYNYQKEPLEMVKNTGDATTDGWGKVDIYDMIFLIRKFAWFTPDHGIDYLNRAMKNIRPGGYVILWEPYADMYDNVP
ncbi:MAG: hypothetical protein IMF06_15775, partial [Proteobacteria bacterium]|nr:hypothetical protein [Pseudomonadota bacterium]